MAEQSKSGKKKKVKECLIHCSDDDSNFVTPTNEEFRCKSL